MNNIGPYITIATITEMETVFGDNTYFVEIRENGKLKHVHQFSDPSAASECAETNADFTLGDDPNQNVTQHGVLPHAVSDEQCMQSGNNIHRM